MENEIDKKFILFKPNELIEIEGGNITTINRLAYNYIIHKLQQKGANSMKINISEFFMDLKLGKNYDELVDYLDSLQKIRVISRDKKGKLWGAFYLLSYFKANNDGTFEVEIPNIVFNSLCEKNKFYYTTIKLLEEKSLKCTYGVLFYEIFKKYEKVNIPSFELETLRKITGTEEKYKEYKDFKRYVLEKGLKELNKNDLEYSYSFFEKKLGRKVNEIQFIRTEKNKKKNTKDEIIDAEIVEENTMSEKLLKAIKKAKKSMYISKVYSDKAMKKLLVKYDESLIIRALEESAKYNQEINSFSSFITAKVEDIKNSSNKAIEKKLEELNKNVTSTPKEKEKKEITEDNIADIFNKKDDKIEELKILLLKQIEKKGKLSLMLESTIKACRKKEDVKMIADSYEIEL